MSEFNSLAIVTIFNGKFYGKGFVFGCMAAVGEFKNSYVMDHVFKSIKFD